MGGGHNDNKTDPPTWQKRNNHTTEDKTTLNTFKLNEKIIMAAASLKWSKSKWGMITRIQAYQNCKRRATTQQKTTILTEQLWINIITNAQLLQTNCMKLASMGYCSFWVQRNMRWRREAQQQKGKPT